MNAFAVISDIHGNYPALREVINDIHKHDIKNILCLGDISGYYCMVNECIELLLHEKVFCLKGNHDSYLLGEGVCPRSHSVNDCINYQKKIIKPFYLHWLNNFKPFYRNESFVAMHGGLQDYLDEYTADFSFETALEKFPGIQLFMSGHTHIQKQQSFKNLIYFNPGSVGQPRDYDNRAAYAIVNRNGVELYRVSYNIDEIANAMNQAGFEDYYYRNLYKGCRIGEV